jgi:hypothetical protein
LGRGGPADRDPSVGGQSLLAYTFSGPTGLTRALILSPIAGLIWQFSRPRRRGAHFARRSAGLAPPTQGQVNAAMIQLLERALTATPAPSPTEHCKLLADPRAREG